MWYSIVDPGNGQKWSETTYKDGKKGVIPDILDMLLTARKDTRKKIEYVIICAKNLINSSMKMRKFITISTES